MPAVKTDRTGNRMMPAGLLQISSAMTDSPIVFIDSGVGGLPYLEWLRLRRPDLPVSYIADTQHFPYGERSSEEVRNAVLHTAGRLFEKTSPRLLVLACNTASVAALDALRDISGMPVVGTVPAVKPAAKLNTRGPIGVLATQGTVTSPYLDDLEASFSRERPIARVAAGDIVRYVEERMLEEEGRGVAEVLDRALEELKEKRVGSVVMGCTHFLHVMEDIASIMGDIPLVDSRDGVGRRILSLLNEDSRPAERAPDAQAYFYVTEEGETDERYKRFAENYGLDWKGRL